MDTKWVTKVEEMNELAKREGGDGREEIITLSMYFFDISDISLNVI